MKNDGNVYSLKLNKTTNQEKLALAEEFAEGSPALNKLLLAMWNNNINTFGCCKGHHRKLLNRINFAKPYISFSIDNFTNEQIEWFIKNLSNSQFEENNQLDFAVSIDTFGENGEERCGLSVSFKRGTIAEREEFFALITKLINGLNKPLIMPKLEIKKFNKIVLNACLQFKLLSLTEYHKKTNKDAIRQFRHIAVYKWNRSIFMQTLNNCNYVIHKEKNEKGEIIKRYKVAEGYYTVTDNNELYTLENNKVKKLSDKNKSKYKPLDEDIKYNGINRYSEALLNEIIAEIKQFN